jgi:hypothetical protein
VTGGDRTDDSGIDQVQQLAADIINELRELRQTIRDARGVLRGASLWMARVLSLEPLPVQTRREGNDLCRLLAGYANRSGATLREVEDLLPNH